MGSQFLLVYGKQPDDRWPIYVFGPDDVTSVKFEQVTQYIWLWLGLLLSFMGGVMPGRLKARARWEVVRGAPKSIWGPYANLDVCRNLLSINKYYTKHT